MRIGIISDTHNELPAEVFPAFRDVEMILHAGDIGSESIITDLETIAPVRAIAGNTDTFPLVSRLRRIDFFTVHETRFCLIHAIRGVKAFAFELLKMKQEVDIVVYGHTHSPSEKEFNNILFLNPGSASSPRHSLNRSVGILNLEGDLKKWEVINI